MEEWRPIVGYEGFYEVSNKGQIRSLTRIWFHKNRWGTKTKYHAKGKKMRFSRSSSGTGYFQVVLCKDTVKRWLLVHRIVALAFCARPSPKCEVNHINGNKLDNEAKNLEWVTRLENIRHCWETGRRRPGEYHNRSKLTQRQVDEIRANFDYEKLKTKRPGYLAIGRKYGVHRNTIRGIIKREHWTS